MFEVCQESVKHCKDRHFLATHLYEAACMNIYTIKPKLPYQCSNKFSMFWCQSNFLAYSVSYAYKVNDFTQQEVERNKKFESFFEDLVYIDDVIPSDVESKKQGEAIHLDTYADGCRLKRGHVDWNYVLHMTNVGHNVSENMYNILKKTDRYKMIYHK